MRTKLTCQLGTIRVQSSRMNKKTDFGSPPAPISIQTMEPSNIIVSSIRNGYKRMKDFVAWILSHFLGGNLNKRPSFLIFVGSKESGKTTAIKQIGSSLLGRSTDQISEQDSSEYDIVEDQEPKFSLDHPEACFQKWSFLHDDSPIDLVEAPSFRYSYDVAYNAKIISSLYHFLERFHDTTIPTMVVITFRLNEQRFQGEFSDFSYLLKYLKFLGNRLSDCHWSNVILLLTNADRADIQDTVEQRISAVKTQYKAILGVDPICYITGITGSKIISASQMGIFGTPAQSAENSSAISEKVGDRKKITFLKKQVIDLQSMPLNVQNSQKLEELIESNTWNGDVFKATTSVISFVPSNQVSLQTFCHKKGYFDPIEITDYGLDLTGGKIYNVVDAKSQILLSDGQKKSVLDLFVGHRLMGHNGVGVITKLVKIRCKGYDSKRNILAGEANNSSPVLISELFPKVKNNSEARYIHLADNSSTYAFVDDKPNFMPKFSNRELLAVYIEVDGGKGTFVANGYVRKCNVDQDDSSISYK